MTVLSNSKRGIRKTHCALMAVLVLGSCSCGASPLSPDIVSDSVSDNVATEAPILSPLAPVSDSLLPDKELSPLPGQKQLPDTHQKDLFPNLFGDGGY